MDENENWFEDDDAGDIGDWQHYVDTDAEETDFVDYDEYFGGNMLSVKSLISEVLTCSIPVIEQAYWLLFLILSSCLLWHFAYVILNKCFACNGKIYRTFVTIFLHILSICLGLTVLYHSAYELWWIIIGLTISLASVFILNVDSIHYHSNGKYTNWESFITIGICSSVQLYCELYMNPVQWHQIRGSVMIIIMKSISFSMEQNKFNDLINSEPYILLWTPLYRGLVWLSYCLCPASLLFGPWFNPLMYEQIIRNNCMNMKLSLKKIIISLFHVFRLYGLSLACLVYSTCFTHTLLTRLRSQPWLYAYFASQSFRFSHYFVCLSSESFMAALGYCDKYSTKSKEKADTDEEESITEVYRPVVVTQPWFIEFPRSLVEVVIQWNIPMHNWLKQYIYKPLRAYGHIYAILGTYTVSSLLHGLNFQLSAVLFSIGIYAYIEYVFRENWRLF
ncbi:unnamed protein product [Heterobilharzia americana]|nr:unnamed protein product [Heterobilharzia americana]